MDPGAAMTVLSPLVGAPVAPVGDDTARAARRALDLPDDALVVVVTVGSPGPGEEVLSAAAVVAAPEIITRPAAAVLPDDRAGVPAPAWG